jgi:hypothetical protein
MLPVKCFDPEPVKSISKNISALGWGHGVIRSLQQVHQGVVLFIGQVIKQGGLFVTIVAEDFFGFLVP